MITNTLFICEESSNTMTWSEKKRIERVHDITHKQKIPP